MPVSSIWKRDFLFLGLWWEPLENNANIFYLKTEFPCFFWACDGNLIWKTGFPCLFGLFWQIISISSIWKRNFRVFSELWAWWEPLENNDNSFYLKTGFPLFFFGLWDGNLWKIISISSIWKRNFRVFSGLVMGTSFENGISVSFWAFLENNANIFYLKTGFSCFFFWLVMGTSFENGMSVSFWTFLENNASIFYLKTGFPFFGLVMGTPGK